MNDHSRPRRNIGKEASHVESATVAACLEENRKLLETIQLLRSESPSSVEGILEGKYLAEIKKTRTLTVQLESEQARVRELQTRLEAKEAHILGEAKLHPLRPHALSCKQGSNASGEDSGQSLKERLERAYAQLQERDLQATEQKREILHLKKLLAREVGKSVEGVNEWIQAMGWFGGVTRDAGKEAGGVASQSPRESGSAGKKRPPKGVSEACLLGGEKGSGWKGRAEQIVLLQAKVKDLERQLEALAPENNCASAETVSQTENDAASKEPSVGNRRRRKDVDAEARERVTMIHDKRLKAARELAAELDAANHALEEGKRKYLALQARYGTVQQDCTQLRAHIQLLLDKSSRDDELIQTCREELAIARKEAPRRGARRVPAKVKVLSKVAEASGKDKEPDAAHAQGGLGSEDNETSPAALPSPSRSSGDLSPEQVLQGLQAMNQDLLEKNRILEAHLIALSHAFDDSSTELPASQDASDSQKLLLTWVIEACATLEAANRQIHLRSSEDNSLSVVAMVNPRAVAAVLHNACAHVAFVEQQNLLREPLPSGWMETLRQHLRQAGASDTAVGEALARLSSSIESVLIKENTGLKERLRSLIELLAKEEQIQATLWAQQAANGEIDLS